MASGGHLMQQSKAELRGDIPKLRVEELKQICRVYGYQVSGKKELLVVRVKEILDEVFGHGNPQRITDLQYRIRHQGRNPPNGSMSAPNSAPSYSQNNMAPRGRGLPGVRGLGKDFKPSPFFDYADTLVPFTPLPEMNHNRHTVKSHFSIRPDIAQQMRGGGNFKIMLYCALAADLEGHFHQANITFPSQIEVRVNDQEVRSNFKGVKGKPGSTKPVDITSCVRKFKGENNVLQVTYALTQHQFKYTVYLVKYNSGADLVERIKKNNVIRKQTVLNNMNKAISDDDVAATSFRMSLKDPVSYLRIGTPIRSSHCTHYQCFDAAMYMALQEQAPQWACPVCSKTIPFDTLCVDEYFQEILASTPQSTEKIDVQPDGAWKVIEDENDSQANGTSSKGARASYDDDFDDIVEVDQPGGKDLNGIKKSGSQASFPGRPAALDTPPLSSREPSVAQSASSAQRNKRPQSAVVDLTLSDDDEPPRPAKRTNTSQRPSNGVTSNAYNTPNSNAEPRLTLQRQVSNHASNVPTAPPQQSVSRAASMNSLQHRPSPTYNSMSPPSNHGAPVFGQSSFPVQNARPPGLALPQPYQPNSHTYSNNVTGAAYPDNNNYYGQPSPFLNRSPVNQYFPQPDHPPANISSGGLRLPPMQPRQPPPQQQERNPWSSSPPPYAGGWRSDGSDYQYGSGGAPL